MECATFIETASWPSSLESTSSPWCCSFSCPTAAATATAAAAVQIILSSQRGYIQSLPTLVRVQLQLLLLLLMPVRRRSTCRVRVWCRFQSSVIGGDTLFNTGVIFIRLLPKSKYIYTYIKIFQMFKNKKLKIWKTIYWKKNLLLNLMSSTVIEIYI